MQPAFVLLRGIVELILKLEFVLQRVSVETINQPVPLRLWVVEMIQKPEFVLLRGSLQTIKQSEFEQLRRRGDDPAALFRAAALLRGNDQAA